MILLDTNIISETLRPQPDARVLRWLNGRAKMDFWLCTPVIAELRYGAAILPEGRKRDALFAAWDRLEDDKFAGRILTFDRLAARHYAELSAMRRALGKSIASMDAMIAAIASAHSMTLATRNIQDFEGLGLPLINPFEA
jgi:predicted nucleic acid-binding protein